MIAKFFADLISYISAFFTNIVSAITQVTRFSNQALGSINALSASWGSVGYFGPVVGAMILAIIAFVIID